jgi:hypothetical protein
MKIDEIQYYAVLCCAYVVFLTKKHGLQAEVRGVCMACNCNHVGAGPSIATGNRGWASLLVVAESSIQNKT